MAERNYQIFTLLELSTLLVTLFKFSLAMDITPTTGPMSMDGN